MHVLEGVSLAHYQRWYARARIDPYELNSNGSLVPATDYAQTHLQTSYPLPRPYTDFLSAGTTLTYMIGAPGVSAVPVSHTYLPKLLT
jgi:hypothetical protein